MKRSIAYLFIIAIHLSGCTTLKPVESHHSALSAALRIGDEVRISTHDGKSREFKIATLSAEELCGVSECVPVRDIATIEQSEFSAWKTAGVIAAIVVLGFIVAAARAPFFYWPAPHIP